MIFVWVSKNRISPEHSQIQRFPHTLTQWSAALMTAPKQHGCVPTTNALPRRWSFFPCQMELYRMPDLTRMEELSAGPYQYQALRTTGSCPDSPMENEAESWGAESVWESRIGSLIWAKQNEALLGMITNRAYALWWTWAEQGIIGDDVKPPHRI